jgi:tRNA(fMet)-specific endonuclease VapC
LDESCISVITRGELLAGVAESKQRERTADKVMKFLRYMQVLDLSLDVADDYGLIRAELRRRGTPIEANDYWIAAHARHLGLTLVTNNMREFSRVPGLKIENWAEPQSA